MSGTRSSGEQGEGDGLAYVVMSLGDQPGLPAAVRSLERQSPTPEIVVVNSAGGDPELTLVAAGVSVPVVNRAERLLPGAARNLGVAATRERFVAFLAADCLAEPGCVAACLRAHRAGVAAVASVMTNAFPWSRSASAAHLLLYSRRLPQTSPRERLLYGVSYDRFLFERLGPFREDVREGEDTDFNARVAALTTIRWDPGVRTAHRNPTSPLELLGDQYARGRRSRVYDALPARRLILASMVKRAREALRLGLAATEKGERRRLLEAMPLVVAGAAAFTAGLLVARLRPVRRSGVPPG